MVSSNRTHIPRAHGDPVRLTAALVILAFAGVVALFSVSVDWSNLSDEPASNATSAGAEAPAPAPEPGAPATGGNADAPLAGVQLHPLWGGVTPGEAARELDVARQAGARVVRIDVGWSTLESDGKGRIARDYSRRLDAFLKAAAKRRIGVIATLHETPCWASAAPSRLRQGCRGPWWERGVSRFPPRRAGDYADAAEYVARRWGRRLLAFEIWNEPNVQAFLRTADPVVAYARLVRTSYRRIKRVAPRLTVLAGSLLRSDGEFLRGLYERGKILGHYDAISYHPYSETPEAEVNEDGTEFSLIAGTTWLHDIMVSVGDPEPALWATEAGASTCDPERFPGCVSERDQAGRITSYMDVIRRFPYVHAIVIYSLRDRGSDPGDVEQGFGLTRADLSRKPSFAAFRAAATGR